VSLAITVRMQTPARAAGNQGWFDVVARSRDANTSGVRLGNGTVSAASEFAPLPVSQINPNGVTVGADTQNRTGAGSTQIGDLYDGGGLGSGGGSSDGGHVCTANAS
jgi:hypothetical protein